MSSSSPCRPPPLRRYASAYDARRGSRNTLNAGNHALPIKILDQGSVFPPARFPTIDAALIRHRREDRDGDIHNASVGTRSAYSHINLKNVLCILRRIYL